MPHSMNSEMDVTLTRVLNSQGGSVMNVLVLCLVSVSCLLSSVLTLTIVPARQRQPLASKLIVSMQRGGKKVRDILGYK